MLPDAEILAVACETLDSLGIDKYTIKVRPFDLMMELLVLTKLRTQVNHRKILDGIFAVCGVPLDKTRAISSAVDKLDKVRAQYLAPLATSAPSSPSATVQMDWAGVKKEMVQDKGLDADVADRIGTYVKLKGASCAWILRFRVNLTHPAPQVRKTLSRSSRRMRRCARARRPSRDSPTWRSCSSTSTSTASLTGYESYIPVSTSADHPTHPQISFDLSLARGLDYYTGIIYEAVTEGSAPPIPSSSTAAPPKPKGKKPAGEDDVDESAVGVGSIAAGGRYDELVGMFSPSGSKIPCVGISFGVERIFSLMLLKAKAAGDEAARGKMTEVFVMSVGDGLLEERMKICAELWKAGIKVC